MFFLAIPFALQGLAMFFDEFYFHRKRGLPLWEKVGHPLDTITVLGCYLFMLFNEPSVSNSKWLVGLMAFSCLFITKDEFVHIHYCEAQENWLHSVLFVLHPVSFMSAFFIWKEGLNPKALVIQSIVIFCFMIYQITYWSFYGKKSKQRDI